MTPLEAQKKITEILRELEQSTRMLVMDVNIKRVDITRMDDLKRRHVRTIDIVLELPEQIHEPGGGWE